MARKPVEKGAQTPARPKEDAIDSEQKAREESELEEHKAPRFWETDDEHQRRMAGEPVEDAPLSDETDHVQESERHGDQSPTEHWKEQEQHVTQE